ncbi:lipopolysaccharide heptosyltransferase II [bacterium F11]|nr:lipopolysaccharide heptosyltransferase II [bacterium F11]
MSSKKILVIRFSSLGDVVLSTALLPNLKKKWPDSQVSFLTKSTYASVFDRNPFVDHVYIFDASRQTFSQLTKEIRLENFDMVIDLHNNVRSWFICFMARAAETIKVEKLDWARRKLVWFKRKSKVLDKSFRERVLDCLVPLGATVESPESQLFPSLDRQLEETFSLSSHKNLIGLAPGAKHATKRWTIDGFVEVANRLGAIPDSKILLLGDKSDEEISREISKRIRVPCESLTGWTSLSELIAIISKLRLLITNDSGLMHIGEALNIPLVALFGPTVRAFGFAPYRRTSRVVEVTNLPCRPCSLHGEERCPLKHHRCMKDLDANAVLLASSMLLEKGETRENSLEDCPI